MSRITVLPDTLHVEQVSYRTKLLVGFSIFFIAFVFLFMSFYVSGSTHAATDTVDKIHAHGKTPTSEIIDWRGPEQGIFYGLTTNYKDVGIATGTIGNAEPFMRIELTGLQPDSTYHFKIGLYGTEHTFRTLLKKQ